MASSKASEVESCITGLLTSKPFRCTLQQFCTDYKTVIGSNIPFRQLGFSSVEEYLRSIPNTVKIIGSGPSAEVEGVITNKSAHISVLVSKQKKDNIPAHKRKYLKTYKVHQPVNTRKSYSMRDLTHQTSQMSVCNDEYKSKIPKRIQNNLRKLIMRFPEGITCRALQHEYRKMFQESLNYEHYKFRSLIEMCTDLQDIFYYVQQTTDDFILYDKNNAVPSLNQNEISETEIESSDIAWSLGPDLIPGDIVPFLEELPKFNLGDINIHDYLDIAIGEIKDINNFFIFPKNGDLSLLEEEMLIRFHNERNRYVIPELFLVEGLYCLVHYQNKYYRCVIVDTSVALESHVKVLFIDYGSVGEIHQKHIWFMPKEFSQVPCQAVKARLSAVKASDSQTTRKFRDLIIGAELVAEIMAIDKEELVLEIYLANVTKEDSVFYINDALVEKGYAEYCVN